MDAHALQVLDYGRLLELIAGYARSGPGAAWVRARQPRSRLRELADFHGRQRELAGLLADGAALPSLSFDDPAAALARARPAGAVLVGEELLICRDFLRALHDLRTFLVGERCRDCRLLRAMGEALAVPAPLLARLERALDDEGNLVDGASPTLAELRRQARRLEERSRRLLEGMLRSDALGEAYQEQFVTLRNGRYVLPVRREARTRVAGVVHDLSDSGRTLFVEPTAAVELGNELAATRLEERDECRRLYAALTAELRGQLPELLDSLRLVAEFDGVGAVVRWAADYGCTLPRFSGQIDLKQVRHPLLEWQFRQAGKGERVVPLAVALPPGCTALVVTGSNSGGKTVALKTLGLAVLAAQAGLPIAAAEDSTLELFEHLFADIGDEQSLAENLSTFTGHLQRLNQVLASLTGGRALILLDELGTGTDPLEGGALGCAFLEEFAVRNALTVATTHLGAIKAFAEEQPRMVNGAVRFNLETLSPEYVLDLGRPGASHALRIAQRLGVPERLLAKARARLDADHLRVESLLATLEEQQRQIAAQEEEARQLLAAAQRDRARQQAEGEEVEGQRRRRLHQACRQAEQIVADTRREMAELLDQLRHLPGDPGDPGERRRQANAIGAQLQERAQQLAAERGRTAEHQRLRLAPEQFEPGLPVWVEPLQANGVLRALSNHGRQALVAVGDLEFTVRRQDLRAADEDFLVAKPKVMLSLPKSTGRTASEIRLLGKRVDEAVDELRDFIARAQLANLAEVRIVHGFGSGRLMRGIHDFLADNGHRGRYRLADPDKKEPGGGGVTILEL